jgi:hypothetical protein
MLVTNVSTKNVLRMPTVMHLTLIILSVFVTKDFTVMAVDSVNQIRLLRKPAQNLLHQQLLMLA